MIFRVLLTSQGAIFCPENLKNFGVSENWLLQRCFLTMFMQFIWRWTPFLPGALESFTLFPKAMSLGIQLPGATSHIIKHLGEFWAQSFAISMTYSYKAHFSWDSIPCWATCPFQITAITFLKHGNEIVNPLLIGGQMRSSIKKAQTFRNTNVVPYHLTPPSLSRIWAQSPKIHSCLMVHREGASLVVQRFGTTCSLRCNPGDPGWSPTLGFL